MYFMIPILQFQMKMTIYNLSVKKMISSKIESNKLNKITNLFIRHPFQRMDFPMTMKYIDQHLFYTSTIQKVHM
jgi:hypothetical protein